MQSAHRDQCHTTSIPISGKRRGRTGNCAGIVIRKLKGLRGNRPQKDHKNGWLRLAGELGEMDQSSAHAWKGTGTCKFHNMITDGQPNRNVREGAQLSFWRAPIAAGGSRKGSMLAICVCRLGGFSHSHQQEFSMWRQSRLVREGLQTSAVKNV